MKKCLFMEIFQKTFLLLSLLSSISTVKAVPISLEKLTNNSPTNFANSFTIDFNLGANPNSANLSIKNDFDSARISRIFINDTNGLIKKSPSTSIVRLDEVGDKKINVIKAVRALTGLGLKEAKEIVDSAPIVFKTGLSQAEAEAVKQSLELAGAKASLESTQVPDISLAGDGSSPMLVLQDVGAADKIALIKLLRELTGFGLKEARELVDNVPTAVLVTNGTSLDEAKILLENLGTKASTSGLLTKMDINTGRIDLTLENGGIPKPVDPGWDPEIELNFDYDNLLPYPDLDITIDLLSEFEDLLLDVHKGIFSLGFEITHNSGIDFYGASFDMPGSGIHKVPEPSLIALLSLGLLGLILTRGRIRQHSIIKDSVNPRPIQR